MAIQSALAGQARTQPAEFESSVSADLPSGWQLTKLGQMCGLRTEATLPHENPDVRYVGLEHMDSGSPTLSRWGAASEVTSSKARFHPGDVLYGKLRPYLDKAALAEWAGICSTDILVLKPGGHLVPDFLAYVLHTSQFVAHAVSSTRGVNHPRTSWSSLSDYEFPLPTLAEQVASVRILSTIQDAIKARQLEVVLERERKAALMQHLFTHGTRDEPTKVTEIGEMPRSWQVVQMGAVCRHLPQNGAFIKDPQWGGGTPFINVADIYRAVTVDVANVQRLECDAFVQATYALRPGDLLFVRSSLKREGVGQCCHVGDLDEPTIFDCHLIRLSPNDTAIDPLCLAYYFQTPSAKSDLIARSKTTTMTTMNQKSLSQTPIPMPSLEEQQAIAATLRACDAQVVALAREATVLEELFRALLEELMTGRLSALPLVEATAAEVPA